MYHNQSIDQQACASEAQLLRYESRDNTAEESSALSQDGLIGEMRRQEAQGRYKERISHWQQLTGIKQLACNKATKGEQVDNASCNRSQMTS